VERTGLIDLQPQALKWHGHKVDGHQEVLAHVFDGYGLVWASRLASGLVAFYKAALRFDYDLEGVVRLEVGTARPGEFVDGWRKFRPGEPLPELEADDHPGIAALFLLRMRELGDNRWQMAAVGLAGKSGRKLIACDLSGTFEPPFRGAPPLSGELLRESALLYWKVNRKLPNWPGCLFRPRLTLDIVARISVGERVTLTSTNGLRSTIVGLEEVVVPPSDKTREMLASEMCKASLRAL
jgi:hypothetical protein